MYPLYFFSVFFRSYVVTIFTHDKFVAINLETVYKILEMVLGKEANVEYEIDSHTWFSMRILVSFAAIVMSLISIRVLELPKMLWFDESDSIWFGWANDSNDPFSHYRISKLNLDSVKSTYNSIELLRKKYMAELFVLFNLVEFLMITRIGGALYLLIWTFSIYFMYSMNKRTKFERKIIWKDNNSYGELYTVLFSLPVMMVLVNDIVVFGTVDSNIFVLLAFGLVTRFLINTYKKVTSNKRKVSVSHRTIANKKVL